jgi:molecular chaperone DnaK
VFSTAADNQTAVSIHVLQGEREMAAQNRTLGNFDLVGIPAAPRGVPQIEVAFDIDANGIVHVSAKDLGTGKEQKIRIESSSGLSESEIEKMVKDAEINAEADRKEREKAEVKNEAETLTYATEKSLKDYGDKVSDEEKQSIQSAVDELKSATSSGDVEQMKAKIETVKQASHKLAEEIYKEAGAQAQQAEGQSAGGMGGAEEQSEDSPSSGSVDDVDFEVMDDEDESK